MDAIGAHEARAHLSRLLERVAKGERITITRRGVPVAVLAPPAERDRAAIDHAVEELKRFRKGRKLGDLSLRELIYEGRR